MERLFDRPVRKVLADCKSAMEANRKKVSGDLDGPKNFEPAAKGGEEAAPQAAGIRRGGSGSEKCAGELRCFEHPKLAAMRSPASNADTNRHEFTVMTEGPSTVIDARWIFEFRGEPGTVHAAGGLGATILAFPSPPSQAAAWAW